MAGRSWLDKRFAVTASGLCPTAVRYYLQSEEKRLEIATAAQSLVTQELTMAAMAHQFLHGRVGELRFPLR